MGSAVSIASENFIKAIYKLENSEGYDARTGIIAKELGITNAAATDMAKKLAYKKLINYQKYKQLELTPIGKEMALNVIRKHRLWETFLHRVLGLTMHEIHREAELLEHLTSDFLARKISMFLGNPVLDPHGDPIPDENGIIQTDEKGIVLSEAEPGKAYEIRRLSGWDKEFFDFCHSNQMTVGSSLFIKRQYLKNKITEIEIHNSKILLHADLANKIVVNELIKTK